MRIITLLLTLLTLVSCKGQDKSEELSNSLNFEVNNTKISIEGFNSILNTNNINEDFIIQKLENNKILIKPAFLESDLVDGKDLRFINSEIPEIKVTYTYDVIYFGEEKMKTNLGFTKNYSTNLKVNNKKVRIPSFTDIAKKSEIKINKEILDKAYVMNETHYKKIISDPQKYGGESSIDFKEALAFFKKKKDSFKKLEDLFVEIDYSKINIEFIDKNNSKNSILFDKGFKPLILDQNTVYTTPEDLFVIDSSFIKLKQYEYKIIALEKKEEKNNLSNSHFKLPIVILEKKGKSFTKKFENDKISFEYNDNCPADGYQGIATNGNYFTIEQISCLDFLFVKSYTTFKIDIVSGKIYLHKYGEEYTDRSNPDKDIPTKIWTNKDFGSIEFENVTEQFLKRLR